MVEAHPWRIQGQAGLGYEHSYQAVGVPIHSRGVGLDGALKVPSKSNDSMIAFLNQEHFIFLSYPRGLT